MDQLDAKAVSPGSSMVIRNGIQSCSNRDGWTNSSRLDFSHDNFFLFYSLNGSFLRQKIWWFFLQLDLHNARSSAVVYWYLNYGCLSADFGWSARSYENRIDMSRMGWAFPSIYDLDGTNGIVSPLPLLWKGERCFLSLAFPQLLNDMLHRFVKSCQLDNTRNCNHIT